ncbi:ABC transporter ATP-binding protein [Occultella gossypii]|uniref:ABC transporter ATP-binding protein n=1 Tax=Occultella gossypii TaxID=2800820 RepID=UPI001CBE6885|nr:ABC transporter ATP-binding protein [Occultella gossypii]
MLEFENVGLRFRGGAGVQGLTFAVTAGEIVALVGLNGAGKTTLMRLALGMLRADHGTVTLHGSLMAELPASRWREVGAMVDAPLAYPELTVRQNLTVARLLRGTDPRLVDDAIARWQLGPVVDRRFRHLSLGNQQRVGLAAALQHEPRLIVLDEPSNALDPASVIVLREHLAERARDGAAILVSSHHLDEVARIADRILVMNAGRLIGGLDPATPDLERTFFARVLEDDEHRGCTP